MWSLRKEKGRNENRGRWTWTIWDIVLLLAMNRHQMTAPETACLQVLQAECSVCRQPCPSHQSHTPITRETCPSTLQAHLFYQHRMFTCLDRHSNANISSGKESARFIMNGKAPRATRATEQRWTTGSQKAPCQLCARHLRQMIPCPHPLPSKSFK